MLKWMPNLLFALWCSVNSSTLQAATTLPGPLVDAEWLAESLSDVIVLDVRKDLDSFVTEGHIEGAILVDAKKVRTTRVIEGVELTRMLPTQTAFENFMSQHGVSNTDTVVLTHQGLTPGQVTGAARLYWQLKYYGFDNVALLDGGNAAWTEALESLVEQVQPITAGKFNAKTKRPEILATRQDIEQVLAGKQQATLIDTRSLRFHVGLEKRDYVYAYGHLPNSKLFPYKGMHNSQSTAYYMLKEEQLATLEAMQINPDDSIILYCNSGYEATSVWFMLHEVLGKTNVRVYDASLHEWTKDKARPITRTLSYVD